MPSTVRIAAVCALDGQGQAGEHGPAVDEDRAGPAFAQLAAVLRPHEAEVFAEDLEQGVVNGRQHLAGLPVHVQPEADLVHATQDLNTCSNQVQAGSGLES